MVGVSGENSYSGSDQVDEAGRLRAGRQLDVSTRHIMTNTITATIGDTQMTRGMAKMFHMMLKTLLFKLLVCDRVRAHTIPMTRFCEKRR
jgi:hypothetical protein